MLTLFWLFFYSLRSSLRTRAALQAEILALRHHFLVLQRSAHGHRLRLQPADRIFWVWLSLWCTYWRLPLEILKPGTVMGWGRTSFLFIWKWKGRAPKDRPAPLK